MDTLTKLYNAVANSSVGFAVSKQSFVLRKELFAHLGIIPNWAIDKDILIEKLEEILPQGRITAMNAAALMCAVSIKHKHSQYDTVDFLKNFLRLYNATNLYDVLNAEQIEIGSDEWRQINRIYKYHSDDPEKNLEAVKIHCWARDLASATDGTVLGRAWGHHQAICVDEVKEIVAMYRPPTENGLLESDGKITLSAFPKNEYLPLLRAQRAAGKISETQCGIILCFILHSQERRRDGASYITHPMAVANLVRLHGDSYLDNNQGHMWEAMVAALLHDGGEKSNIDLDEDLDGLLPQRVIDAVKCLHKQDGEMYFDYLERCAQNPLAAVVKLCDLYHNSLDDDKPSIKQTYTYPIAAAYLEYALKHPSEHLSVVDFVAQQKICTVRQYRDIVEATDIYRKAPLEEHQDRLGIIYNVKPLKDYFQDDTENMTGYDAYPRREESPSLHV